MLRFIIILVLIQLTSNSQTVNQPRFLDIYPPNSGRIIWRIPDKRPLNDNIQYPRKVPTNSPMIQVAFKPTPSRPVKPSKLPVLKKSVKPVTIQPMFVEIPTTQATTLLPNEPEMTTQIAELSSNQITSQPSESSGSNIFQLVNANNGFAYKLYRTLNNANKGNHFISPFSIYNTLSVLFVGSGGETRQEMRKVLDLSQIRERDLRLSSRDLLHIVNLNSGTKKKSTVKVLNALLFDSSLKISKFYIDKVRTYFDVYIDKINFMTEPKFILSWINELVSWHTSRQIEQVVHTPPSPYTKMFIVNAITFKSEWAEKFDETQTKPGEFNNFDGTKSSVEMMRLMAPVNCKCDFVDKFCAYELLYAGGKLSFLLIHPKDEESLKSIEKNLSSNFLYSIISGLQENEIDFRMPKFSLSHEYDLVPALKSLGIEKAFQHGKANFSRMSAAQLAVDSAVHKTVIDVDERGTVASGATVLTIATRKSKPRLIVNSPFLFLIRDLATDVILFLGKVAKL